MNATAPQPTDYLTLAQAAQRAPGRPSSNAIWRWCRKGVKSRAGHRVYLQHIRAGGKVLTTAAWVEQFTHDLADADRAHFTQDDTPPQPRPRSPRMVQRAADRAEAYLKAEGM